MRFFERVLISAAAAPLVIGAAAAVSAFGRGSSPAAAGGQNAGKPAGNAVAAGAERGEMEKRLEEVRDEAKALNLIQGVLSWYARTQGEESIIAETYKGHEKLFSNETVRFVGELLRRPAGSVLPPWSADPDDRRRALQYLHTHLALSAVGLETAHFDDEQSNAETTTTVKIPWEEKPVAYRDLQGLLSREENAEKRAQIQAKVAEVYRDVLNPILERKEKRSQEVVRELGFASYIDLSQRYRFVDLKDLIARCDRFYKSSNALYRRLLEEEVREALGMPVEKFRRSDIGRLARAPHLEKFLPKDLMVPSFKEFLKGLGLELKTAAGTDILVDDAPNPNKEPRAACFALRVPRDVRITVKPAGGMDDFHTFFHEGGHALHFGSTSTKQWEFQQLGSAMTTEGWAEFFSHSWDDPAWLVRYRAFVQRWNSEHSGANVPVMTDEDIRKTVRHGSFWNMYFLRRYGHSKLIYETILHGGDPAFYGDIYKGQTQDLQEVYRALFEEAYGFPLTAQDALRFRTDVDDFFYAADYTRAYGFADMMQEAMRRRFGDDWYGSTEAGRLLRETYWKEGTKLQGDEILKVAGYDGLDFDIARQRVERLLAWKGSTAS